MFTSRPLSLGARVRRRGVVAVGVAVLLALTACSSTGAEENDDAASAMPAEEGAFPVTIEHALGETTVEQEPHRVVTLGWAAEDAVVALGVVPVAVPTYAWGGDADGYLPWFREAVEELGGPLPQTLEAGGGGELDFEQILDLAPDVILAPHSGITDEDYERLSQIAPTIAFAQTPWTSSWQEATTVVGAALGRPAQAAQVVAETEAVIAGHADGHPEFEGVTFAYGMGLAEGSSELVLYLPADPRVQIIEALGFETPPSIVDVAAQSDGQSSVGLSLEKLDGIDSDVFIAWANDEDEKGRTLDNPLVARWKPVADGKDLVMTDPSLVWATSSPSVLNIPWALDTLVPQLVDLIGGAS